MDRYLISRVFNLVVLKLYVGTTLRENGKKSQKSQNLIPLR